MTKLTSIFVLFTIFIVICYILMSESNHEHGINKIKDVGLPMKCSRKNYLGLPAVQNKAHNNEIALLQRKQSFDDDGLTQCDEGYIMKEPWWVQSSWKEESNDWKLRGRTVTGILTDSKKIVKVFHGSNSKTGFIPVQLSILADYDTVGDYLYLSVMFAIHLSIIFVVIVSRIVGRKKRHVNLKDEDEMDVDQLDSDEDCSAHKEYMRNNQFRVVVVDKSKERNEIMKRSRKLLIPYPGFIKERKKNLSRKKIVIIENKQVQCNVALSSCKTGALAHINQGDMPDVSSSRKHHTERDSSVVDKDCSSDNGAKNGKTVERTEVTEASNVQITHDTNKQLDETKNIVSEPKSTVNETKNKVDETKNTIDEIKNTVSASKSMVSESTSTVDDTEIPMVGSKKPLGDTKNMEGEPKSKVQQIKKAIDKTSSQVNQISKKIREPKSKYSRKSKTGNKAKNTINNKTKTVDDIKNKVDETKNKGDETNKKVDETKNKVSDKKNKVSEPRSKVSGKNNTVDETKNTVSESKNKVDEIKDRIDETKKKVDETKNKFDETKNKVDETKNQVDETKNNVDETKNMVDETKNKVDETKNKVDETKNKVDETKNMVDETKNQVDETKNKVDETKSTVADTENQVDETKDRVDETKNMVDETENKVDETKNKVNETKNKVDETKNKVDETKNNVVETKSTVADTENQVDETKDRVDETKNKVDETKSTVDDTENRIVDSKKLIGNTKNMEGKQKSKVDQIQKAIGETSSQFNQMIKKFGEPRSKVSLKENTVNKAKNTINNKTNTVDGIKNKVDETKNTVDETKNKVDETKNQVDETKNKVDETKNQVNETKKKVDETKNKFDETKNKVDKTKNMVDETKDRIDETKKKVDETKNKFDETKNKVDETKNQVDETKNNVDETKNMVDETKNKVDETKNKVDETKNKVVETKNKVNETKNKVDKTKNKVNETKNKVDETKNQAVETKNKVDETKNKVDETKNKVNETKNKVDETKNKVDETKNKVNETKNKVVETKNNVDETKNKADETKNQVNETKNKVVETKNKVNETKNKVDKTKNKVNETKNKVDETKNQAVETKNKVDETKNKVDETKNKVNETKNKVDETKNKVDETKNKVDKTKNKVNETKNKVDETKNNVDETKNKADETKNQVNETKNKVVETKNKVNETKNKVDKTKNKVNETKNKVDKTKNQAVETKNKADETRHKVDETKNGKYLRRNYFLKSDREKNVDLLNAKHNSSVDEKKTSSKSSTTLDMKGRLFENSANVTDIQHIANGKHNLKSPDNFHSNRKKLFFESVVSGAAIFNDNDEIREEKLVPYKIEEIKNVDVKSRLALYNQTIENNKKEFVLVKHNKKTQQLYEKTQTESVSRNLYSNIEKLQKENLVLNEPHAKACTKTKTACDVKMIKANDTTATDNKQKPKALNKNVLSDTGDDSSTGKNDNSECTVSTDNILDEPLCKTVVPSMMQRVMEHDLLVTGTTADLETKNLNNIQNKSMILSEGAQTDECSRTVQEASISSTVSCSSNISKTTNELMRDKVKTTSKSVDVKSRLAVYSKTIKNNMHNKNKDSVIDQKWSQSKYGTSYTSSSNFINEKRNFDNTHEIPKAVTPSSLRQRQLKSSNTVIALKSADPGNKPQKIMVTAIVGSDYLHSATSEKSITTETNVIRCRDNTCDKDGGDTKIGNCFEITKNIIKDGASPISLYKELKTGEIALEPNEKRCNGDIVNDLKVDSDSKNPSCVSNNVSNSFNCSDNELQVECASDDKVVSKPIDVYHYYVGSDDESDSEDQMVGTPIDIYRYYAGSDEETEDVDEPKEKKKDLVNNDKQKNDPVHNEKQKIGPVDYDKQKSSDLPRCFESRTDGNVKYEDDKSEKKCSEVISVSDERHAGQTCNEVSTKSGNASQKSLHSLVAKIDSKDKTVIKSKNDAFENTGESRRVEKCELFGRDTSGHNSNRDSNSRSPLNKVPEQAHSHTLITSKSQKLIFNGCFTEKKIETREYGDVKSRLAIYSKTIETNMKNDMLQFGKSSQKNTICHTSKDEAQFSKPYSTVQDKVQKEENVINKSGKYNGKDKARESICLNIQRKETTSNSSTSTINSFQYWKEKDMKQVTINQSKNQAFNITSLTTNNNMKEKILDLAITSRMEEKKIEESNVGLTDKCPVGTLINSKNILTLGNNSEKNTDKFTC